MNRRGWLITAGLGLAESAVDGWYFFGPTGHPSGDIPSGVVAPLTGDNAKYGDSARKGLDLAVDEVNGTGGVRGRKLRLIYEDSQGVPQKGVSAIQKLITADRVPVVIGDLLSTS